MLTKKTIVLSVICLLLTGMLYGKSTFGPQTEWIMQIYESGTFQMKTTMQSVDESSELEMFAKDGKIAMTMTAGTDKMRIVQKDNRSYMISERDRQILVTPVEQDAVQGFVDTEEIKFTGSGSAFFDGKNQTYEEYFSDGDRMLFFVDGFRLTGIRTISVEVGIVDMIVHNFEGFVPDSAFDIPTTGYSVFTEFDN